MFENIYSNDSVRTQNAKEVELRIRAREEQRFMLGEDSGKEEAVQDKSTGHPLKARLAGILSNSKALLQALVGMIPAGR
jgi:hypothetical protein